MIPYDPIARHLALELPEGLHHKRTRMRGHLTVVAGGVHDGRQVGLVYAAVRTRQPPRGPLGP